MSEQAFISYRRDGGDVSAKLICEALKNNGFTVFYDYDSLHGGYFDTRILSAIENCNDFVLVLPPQGLDRCVNDDDWVRQEIVCALNAQKNVIPVMLPGFEFPKTLPDDISVILRINAVSFSMSYFDAMITTIIDRMVSSPRTVFSNPPVEKATTDAVSSNSPAEEDAPGDISNFRFEPNEDNGYTAFCLINNKTNMVIPGEYNQKPVTRIGEKAFYRNKTLTDIKIPSTVTVIEQSAFEDCSGLKTAALPNRLIHIGTSAFKDCMWLKAVVMPNSVTCVGAHAFEDCFRITTLKLSTSLTCIEDRAFSSLSNVTEVVIPPSVTSIKKEAFRGCEKIAHFFIPNSVTEIGHGAFSDCSSLTEIILPNNLKTISGWMFSNCTALKQISIPESVTGIGDCAFYHCSALKSVIIPTCILEGDGITYIGMSAFEGCSKLTKITLPTNLKSIYHEDIQPKTFAKCKSLKKIYYYGGKERWEKLSGKENLPLLARKIVLG